MSARIAQMRLTTPVSVGPCNAREGATLCIFNAHGAIVAHSPEATTYKSPLQQLVDGPNFRDIAHRVNMHNALIEALRTSDDALGKLGMDVLHIVRQRNGELVK